MTTIHESGHGSSALTGTRTLLHRVLLTYRHSPALLFVTLTAPLGMMLLFGFVFAGALSGGEGATYRAYLMPGVLVLVAAMGLATTAATANADMRSGLSDRFRTLPTSPVAAPAGLVFAETLTCAVTLAPMVGIGYLVGWRIEADAGRSPSPCWCCCCSGSHFRGWVCGSASRSGTSRSCSSAHR
ncbi:ABC transporter permease [Rhodococcus rhodochrous]|uniref:ABC transporter permease n=1 Tax=Rhodococcus rhodochrous TaxID=1829 RepID=UPI0021F732B8|nr:ABC transporter permease [Rhodococcus rhodochrous]